MHQSSAAVLALVVALVACGSFGSSDSNPDDSSTDAGGGGDGGTERADAQEGAAPDASAAGYQGTVLADQPLVYLRLDEASGVRAADSSGHGTDGAFLGSVAYGLPGAIAGETGTATRFGMVNWDAEKVRVIPSFDFAGRAPYSLEAWVKPETDGDGAYSGIIGRGGWTLYTQYDVGWIKFTRTGADATTEGPWYQTSLPRDRFTHVVGTYDGAMLHLYIDGLDVGSAPSTLDVPASTDPILIGPHFPGILDEVAIYDHALAPERVRAHHQKGIGQ